ncbi:hypothetical protein GCM10027290_67840 [Micromonospora sonneratiae]|uniref:Peptidase inhibitor family I36 n=1 Tax=Micromonospora sonneratiae TaxID=1184706 RepID=A0ABW3YFT8_9ACTN
MRNPVSRIAAGLAAVLITTLTATLPALPAAAGDPVKSPDEGLVLYSSYPTEVVGRQGKPDDVCRQVPTDATWLLAWSGGFGSVSGYRTPDCSGQPSELNNFHSWPKGHYLTYKAG